MQRPDSAFRIGQRRSSRGATLVLGLVILLVVTILGIAAKGTSTLELMMSANNLDKGRSFQGAESARVEAESRVIQVADGLILNGNRIDCTIPGFYSAGDPPGATASFTVNCDASTAAPNDIRDLAWDDADSVAVAGNDAERFIIEYLGQRQVVLESDPFRGVSGAETPVKAHVFRVGVRGLGDDGAYTFVQGKYMRAYTGGL